MNKTRDFSKKGLREGAGVSTGKRRAMKGEEKQADGVNEWKAKAPERLWKVLAKTRDAAIMDVHKA